MTDQYEELRAVPIPEEAAEDGADKLDLLMP
jgi:hypothetical protein